VAITVDVSQEHPFHLVTGSPWPFLISFGAFGLTLGGVAYFHSYRTASVLVLWSFFYVCIILSFWARDIIREATFEGFHTKKVMRLHKFGVALFIISEVFFFISFFWAFFHSSLSPAIQIGAIWPPCGIITFNPYKIPLFNTYVLLYSGITITAAHHFLLQNNFRNTLITLIETLELAFLFTACQIYEYKHAIFSISDGIYGSLFFMMTGFHGFHVLAGTFLILFCFFSILS